MIPYEEVRLIWDMDLHGRGLLDAGRYVIHVWW